nr:transposase [Rhizobium cauense]
MNQYIGLDISLKETAISIRQDGKRIWRGRCPSDPKLLARMIRMHAPHARRVVFETGPLSTWFYHALTAERMPAICIEARHAQKVLNETLNKTDANDADGLAQLAEAGFYKVVRTDSQRLNNLRSGSGSHLLVNSVGPAASNVVLGLNARLASSLRSLPREI